MLRDRVRVRPRGYIRGRRLIELGGVSCIVVDVDGCLTDGRLVVDRTFGAKPWKAFGPDDHDALAAARAAGIRTFAVTADTQGEHLVRARVEHMGMALVITSACNRAEEISAMLGKETRRVLYVGDGYHDHKVFDAVGFGVAPNDAWPLTRRHADAVTSRDGGRRAVAQAVDYALRRLK